jgi:hypothetical protein
VGNVIGYGSLNCKQIRRVRNTTRTYLWYTLVDSIIINIAAPCIERLEYDTINTARNARVDPLGE